MIGVLDANALIAFLRDEPGSAVVEAVLLDPANSTFAHSVNLCEVYYDFRRAEGEAVARGALDTLRNLGITFREDMDPAFWEDAGRIKSDHRRISLADCFCMALARRLDADLVTGEHHEFDPLVPLGLCRFHFIR